MTDDPPILGVAPVELDATAPELEQPAAPAAPEELGPVRLDRQGKQVIAGVLKIEGEIVRTLRNVPAEEPEAWRWTDAEISALMPAFEGLAERYGVAAQINDHAPQAGAALAIAMHANRSLAAERAWRAAHDDTPPEEPADVGRPDPAGPEHVLAADLPGDGPDVGGEPAAAEPGEGPGPVDLGRVADHLGPPRVRGGG